MQEVCCRDCGESLGFQQADTQVVWELWRHNGCPVRIAHGLGLSSEQYDMAMAVATVAITGAYPEFPNGYLDTSREAADIQHYRARIAARCAFESLSIVGFRMNKKEEDMTKNSGTERRDERRPAHETSKEKLSGRRGADSKRAQAEPPMERRDERGPTHR